MAIDIQELYLNGFGASRPCVASEQPNEYFRHGDSTYSPNLQNQLALWRLRSGTPLEVVAIVRNSNVARAHDPRTEDSMRKYLLFAIIAGLLAIMAPLAVADTPDDETVGSATVAVQRVHVPSLELSDEVSMVLIGTALIGLAAAVRRAA